MLDCHWRQTMATFANLKAIEDDFDRQNKDKRLQKSFISAKSSVCAPKREKASTRQEIVPINLSWLLSPISTCFNKRKQMVNKQPAKISVLRSQMFCCSGNLTKSVHIKWDIYASTRILFYHTIVYPTSSTWLSKIYTYSLLATLFTLCVMEVQLTTGYKVRA